jgi:hypothetical protein
LFAFNGSNFSPSKRRGMTESDQNWLPVIARALAYLCMRSEERKGAGIQENAEFLENLGLSRADAAAMLGTTSASITELHRRVRKNKRGKRGQKNQKKKKSSRRR